VLAVKDDHCRLCWQQARRESQLAGGLPRGAVSVLEAGTLGCHQLFFDRMQGRRAEGPARQHHRRGAPRKPPPAPASCPAVRWLQPRLFETGKDFTRFDEDSDADLQNPWLIWATYLAHRRGEARGWKRGIRLGVRRALIIVLSGHAAGDTVCYSEIFPALRARDLSVERAAEVLQEMGVLVDNRRPSFEGWLERKLEGLAEGKLAGHARRGAVMIRRRQRRHPPVPRRRRQPQPRHEPGDLLHRDRLPGHSPVAEEHEPVLQVVRVGLDRVRGPFYAAK